MRRRRTALLKCTSCSSQRSRSWEKDLKCLGNNEDAIRDTCTSPVGYGVLKQYTQETGISPLSLQVRKKKEEPRTIQKGD